MRTEAIRVNVIPGIFEQFLRWERCEVEFVDDPHCRLGDRLQLVEYDSLRGIPTGREITVGVLSFYQHFDPHANILRTVLRIVERAEPILWREDLPGLWDVEIVWSPLPE